MKTKLAAIAVAAITVLCASSSFAQSVVAINPNIRADHAQLVAGREQAREAHEAAMAAQARVQRDREELQLAWHAGDMRAVAHLKMRLAADRNAYETAKAAEHADRAGDRAKWMQLREDISASHR